MSGLTEQEVWDWEEERGLPHLPSDPPPPADPKHPTRDEVQAGLDHMVSCMEVMALQETMLGDQERAVVYRLARDQFALLSRAVMAAGGEEAVPPEAWAEIARRGDALHRRARRIRDERDRD